eukprot:SAG22_NODE_991_length_6129_cov_8.370813_10_plen_92_part_00
MRSETWASSQTKDLRRTSGGAAGPLTWATRAGSTRFRRMNSSMWPWMVCCGTARKGTGLKLDENGGGSTAERQWQTRCKHPVNQAAVSKQL